MVGGWGVSEYIDTIDSSGNESVGCDVDVERLRRTSVALGFGLGWLVASSPV